MKNHLHKIIFTLILVALSTAMHAQLPAFPGAEGFGKNAIGGRNGLVYHVTNLNDTGTGSLRDAVSVANRIVVFDVAGVIKINSVLTFAANLYIAGQTAPGEGITVYGNRVSFSGANNTICRYMKFRMGSIYGDSGKDACGIANGSNMIFDHCSISWGRDETFSVSWDSKGTEPTNITIQNCIVAQGLMSHSAGGLIQTNGGVTLYRNLYVDNDTRNNKIKGVNQYVNNMVYNWSSAAYIMGGDSEGESFANCVGNYFIKGPEGGNVPLSGANANFHIYADDNWFDNNLNGVFDGYEVPFSEYNGGPDFQAVPYNYPVLPTIDARLLFDQSLPSVGASLPCRDLVDYYVVSEVKSLGVKGAIITSEDEMPFGAPNTWSLWAGTTRIDSDKDGMPDDYENTNGLNPALLSDAMALSGNGYTNIENYINNIDGSFTQQYLRKPLNLSLKSSTQNSVTLSWFDYTEKEDGYIVERQIGGVFTEIGRTVANIDSFKVTGLLPEESGVYQVKAFNSTLESGYSNQITYKAKPIPVAVLDLSTYSPDIIWNGAANSNWDKSSLNWDASTGTVAFADEQKVMFGNQASAQAITLSEAVSPAVTVVSADNNYTFTGSAGIGGLGSVNKAGAGTLALLTDNSYTGATVLHGGILEINKLANGGLPSSIGASQNYDFNWVWKGGTINYTGTSVLTDRSAVLEANTAFAVTNSAATLTISGVIAGQGGLNKLGTGKLLFNNANTFSGETTITGGILELNGLTAIGGGLGSSNIVNLKGGTLKTSGGENANYETYNFALNVVGGTASVLEVAQTCYLKGKVSGAGTLNFNIYYVREYLQGDWSQFTGTLNAKGLGVDATNGNQLMINNVNGIPNGRVVTSGNTKIVCWANAKTMYLGGLSGPSGTYLAGGDKQNNAATCTWVVGGAGTDETFSGIINNECSNKSYKGVTTIIKEGIGLWRLTGTNIYSGTTTVKDGKLIVNGIHTSTAKTTVEDGGMLAGTGKLPATVEIQSGASLEPGDGSIGTFTVGALSLKEGSTTLMDINRNMGTNDKVAATSVVAVGGTLQLNITGILVAGNSFTLFTGTSFSGSFSKIIPETPGEGLIWSYANGILSVVDAATPVLENTAKQGIAICPNPAHEFVAITTPAHAAVVDIRIGSITGKDVLEQRFTAGSPIVVNIAGLTRGVYLMTICVDGQKLSVQKLVKE